MTHALYPTNADVENYITGLGLTFNASSLRDRPQLSAAPAAALWETQSLWYPFLSSGEPEDRFYDPPLDSRYLQIGGGLLSLTSLTTGYAEDSDAVISAGFVQTLGEGFRCLPMNAPRQGKPFEIIEFLAGGYSTSGSAFGYPFSGFGDGYSLGAFGRASSVKLTGVFGRVREVPDDVWQAVLEKAVLLSLPALSMALFSGLLEFSEGGVSEKRSTDPLKVVRDSLGTDWQYTLDFYRRTLTYSS